VTVEAKISLKNDVQIVINGHKFNPRAMEMCESITCEMALDKANLITIKFLNPFKTEYGQAATSELLWTDSVAFMPGNVVEVWTRWEQDFWTFVDAAVIKGVVTDFPRDNPPYLEIKALDASMFLMDGTEEINTFQARTFAPGTSVSDIAASVLQDYGFNIDNVDVESPNPTFAVVSQKKSGTSDYAFLKGAANTLNYDFYLQWNIFSERWDAYWHAQQQANNERKTFTWGPDFYLNGNKGGLLLDFRPEFSVRGKSTDVEVFYYDRGAKLWERVPYPPKKKKGKKKKLRWAGDNTTVGQDLAVISHDAARGLRIQASGVSVEVIPAQGFRSPEEAAVFASMWWRARQETIMRGTGSTIGYPDLRPGDVHDLAGVGPYNSPWYFADVTHKFNNGGVYECEFVCRSVIP